MTNFKSMILKNRRKIIVVFLIVLIIASGILAYRADQPVNIEVDPDFLETVRSPDRERETLFIEHSGVKLEADLFIPVNGQTAKPAVIYILGSGHTIYQNYHPGFVKTYLLDLFNSRDIAVLLVNKRGMGNSTGNWLHNDFNGRAADVYAGVEYLKSHSKINPDRIGVMGLSQGGWIANLVAAQHNDIDFFISLSGPSTTVREQMRDVFYNDFKCRGFEGDKLDRKTKNKMRLVELGASLGKTISLGQIGYDSRIINYDPTENIKTVSIPGLFVFGENDRIVPADKNIARLNGIFDGNIPDHLTIAKISGASHQYYVVEDKCTSYEDAMQQSLSQELINNITLWLISQGY